MMQPFITHPNLHAWIQSAALVMAVIGGAFGVFKVLFERRHAREQREHELAQRVSEQKWRMASVAKDLNDRMIADPQVKVALSLLDIALRAYSLPSKPPVFLARSDIAPALDTATNGGNVDDQALLITDAFDQLFYYMGIFEHWISRDLVTFEDVRHPIDYYIGCMAKDCASVSRYLERFGFYRTIKFLNYFESWRSAATAAAAATALGEPNSNERTQLSDASAVVAGRKASALEIPA